MCRVWVGGGGGDFAHGVFPVSPENHRTDTTYENSLILKTALFQFINSFFTLFYIAFIKGKHAVFGTVQECPGDCLHELYVSLGSGSGCLWNGCAAVVTVVVTVLVRLSLPMARWLIGGGLLLR